MVSIVSAFLRHAIVSVRTKVLIIRTMLPLHFQTSLLVAKVDLVEWLADDRKTLSKETLLGSPKGFGIIPVRASNTVTVLRDDPCPSRNGQLNRLGISSIR